MDLNEKSDNDNINIDFWAIINNEDRETMFLKLLRAIKLDPSGKHMNTWLENNRKGLMKSYIDGLTLNRKDVLNISLHTFGIMVYVTLHVKEEKKEIEPKPQSTKLQEDLDVLYSKESIDNAIKELGIFTDETKGNE